LPHGDASDPRPVLALTGLRCCGKTSVGRALAARLGAAFVDLDDEIAAVGRRAGHAAASAGALLAEVGEPTFRDLESHALLRALVREGPFVLAAGGGVVERETNRAALRARALCVHLDAPDAVLVARLERERALRPALLAGESPSQEVPRLRERRAAHFAQLAAIALDAGSENVERVAAWLAARVELVPDAGFRLR
jgi:shikimate kinase